MTKQEFIIAQLKPYFLDPTICGYDSKKTICKYLTDEGKMCVFGKNLTPDALIRFRDTGQSAKELLEKNGENILKEESRNILSPIEWQSMQAIHDCVSNYKIPFKLSLKDLINTLERLSDCNLSELTTNIPSFSENE